ncbi:hypothetical protein BV25DRAFT_336028 [Artomyces pyxidatus]|uniref:Uncharacterized protein n=1 Tax=Artomyces pyxidatus TaxID=48021 RepID=A0ACB8T6B0_9AGAM|nr:hypothetical protein BV25DRAFT_336028 [Artomyces pyxidatus]
MDAQMSHGRPLTTYSKRNRARVFHSPSSSPLPAVDQDDITLSEMSRRMKKRARHATVTGLLKRHNSDDPKRSVKRLKHTPDITPPEAANDRLSTMMSNTLSTEMATDYLVALKDGSNHLQFRTPFNLSPQTATNPGLNQSIVPDRLSPVPATRRSLSRTSSRNLKENSGIGGLASAFHSRSASKTGSPKKKAKKPHFYKKARTLSDAAGPDCKDKSPFRAGTASVTESARPRPSLLPSHCHSGSSTAYMLQQLTDQDWFRPAKALSRSPFSDDYIPPETPPPDWSFATASFFGGVPLETSTPLTKIKTGRAPNEGTPSAPNTPERAKDVVMTDLVCESSTRSAHTTARHSKDSIFSTTFDATATTSHAQRRSKSDVCVEALRSISGSPTGIILKDILMAEPLRTPCSSPMAEDLSGMLSSLGLGGTSIMD